LEVASGLPLRQININREIKMLKKSFILFSFLFLVLGLSGCAKKGLFGKKELKYHTEFYYGEHKKQAKKVLNFCNENYPGWDSQKQIKEANLTKKHLNRLNNCLGAKIAVVPGWWNH